ncbi:MAG: DMT family transporter [Chloroflexota bacterium]|nr:DMT family transporter [Dehalococcoidia bacterium]MDW8254018.1 DMT family transporter [Chloroflexota bacterium]
MTGKGAYFLIAALACGWGTVAIIVRLVNAPSVVAVFYRVLFAGVALGVGLGATGGAAQWWQLVRRPAAVGMGLALALHWLCFFQALRETSVASAVLATTSSPIFLAVLGPLLLNERPAGGALIATGLGIGGVAVLTGLGDPSEVRVQGVALGLLAALLGALIPIAGKHLGQTSRPATIVSVQTAVASLALLPVALASGVALPLRDLTLLATLGIAHTALAFTLYYRALQRVPVQTAGVLGLLEPLSAAVLAWALLGEPVRTSTVVGGALIVLGALLVRPQGE